MEAWNRLIQTVRDQYGVGTVTDALDAGVSRATWYRRTAAEGWAEPYPRVRVAPWVRPSPLTDLSALVRGCGAGSAATGMTAAWLHGLVPPPARLEVAVPADRRVPRAAVGAGRRVRWLRETDVVLVQNLPTLAVEPLLLSLHRAPQATVRGLTIDLLHRQHTTLERIGQRLEVASGLDGLPWLRAMVEDLAGRRPESIFHDVVLTDLQRRGYAPSPRPIRVPTSDGIGVTPDIPILPFQVGIETDGDRFHSDRPQRRRDRRRTARYSSTSWALVPVDWHDWHERREQVLRAIDAAILKQLRRGIGTVADLPPHLRGRGVV